MKVSYVLPGGGVSGGVRVTAQAARLLLNRGHDVRILVGPVAPTLRSRVGKLYHRLFAPGRYDWLESLGQVVAPFGDIVQVRLARDEIVIGVGTLGSDQVRRLESTESMLIQYVHGGWSREGNTLADSFRCGIPKIVVAPHLVPIVEDVCGRKPVAVVPNGIDTSEYFPSVPEEQRDGLGLVFHTAAVKGPEVALAVLDRLRRDLPNVPQYVFGAVRRPQGMPRRSYSMFPSVRSARELYSRARVWIVPSWSEGFPAPILEAMACGAAVVSTDCGGPGDIIRDGENGFLVPVGDVDGLVDRTKRLLSDEGLRLQLVGQAFATVKTFTWERSVDNLEEALSAIIGMRAA